MIRLVLTFTLLFATALLSGTQPPATAAPPDDTAQRVDLCSVLNDPAAFDKKLLEMTGFGSHGFEDSSFWSPTCDAADASIWMEYGGKQATGTMYCCDVPATRSRPEEPRVQGFTISLVEDNKFRKFDTLLHRGKGSIARATVVGRFFAGKRYGATGKWMGFGHMGCCSLIVVQQVLSVDPEDDELDQSSDGNEYEFLENFSSYRYRPIPSGNTIIDLQKKAEREDSSWRFTDHRRVVSEQLATIPSFDTRSLRRLRVAKQSGGRIVYALKYRDKKYLIVAVKPYWLSFYAKDKKNVIWTVTSLVESPYDHTEDTVLR